MIVQYVEPRCERWSRLTDTMMYPADTCVAVFVDALPTEAEALVDRFGLQATAADDRYSPRPLAHRDDGIDRVTFIVSSDLDHAEHEVSGLPYHQLYNGNSPWWALAEPIAFGSVDELAGFALSDPSDMTPMGVASKYLWPNDRPTEEGLRRDWRLPSAGPATQE